jgi:hypothetical protein
MWAVVDSGAWSLCFVLLDEAAGRAAVPHLSQSEETETLRASSDTRRVKTGTNDNALHALSRHR